MIDCNIRPLDPNAQGSWRELTEAYRVLNSGDVEQLEKLVRSILEKHSDSSDVEKTLSLLSVNDLRTIVQARYGGAQNTGDPLPQTGAMS